MDGNADAFGGQRDPFAEDFFLAPYAEELADRAARMRADNRDAIRHFVEVLTFEAMDNSQLKEAVVRLLWNWEAVETSWLAEALFMDVRQVCEVVEAEPVQSFNCLVCGSELRVRSRTHLFRLTKSLEAANDGDCEGEHADLLCLACRQQLAEHAEEQHRLTHLMRQALLADHRKMPYATRRTTQ